MKLAPQWARRGVAIFAMASLVSACHEKPKLVDASSFSSGQDWPWYNGNPNGTHFSTLKQITVANVANLQVAWTFDSGDGFGEAGNQSDMEGNPLVLHGRLYFVSPKGRLFCLNAATGKQEWVFDPAFGDVVNTKQRLRGMSYWSDGQDERLLFTFKNNLMAVDARTGALIDSFGHKGNVDLRENLGRAMTTVSVGNVSPGVVFKDLIIMGSTGNTPGHIRAFDVRTGKLRWIFHTIPWPGEPGYETWPKDAWKTAMGANAWSGLTLDPERGMVFVPVASAGMGSKDFYGADRIGDDVYGTSLVALDANTGRHLWHFQLVRHDLWDRDPPTPPTLIVVKRDGKDIPAVAQATKSGLVFILNRQTGAPLYPIKEIAVPKSDVPGEVSSPTQVVPMAPEPFARQGVTQNVLTHRTPEAYARVLTAFRKLRSGGPFDPPSVQGTLLFPGMDGGAEYGGAAFDPQSELLYINANEMAWILKLKKHPPIVAGESGEALYQNTCSGCHGEAMKGSPPEFPSLIGIGKRLTDEQICKQIVSGGGRMPGFGEKLKQAQIASVVAYLKGDPAQKTKSVLAAPPYPSTDADAYQFDGYTKFLDPQGYPAVTPPWGTLSALDVNSGKYVWRIPLGEYPELVAAGLKNTGSENYGGAVVTAGGVLFIAATVYDNRFRAFDKSNGHLLWETTLPAAGVATPATYSVDGKQFVAIAAGGGKNPKARPAGVIVAFALPN